MCLAYFFHLDVSRVTFVLLSVSRVIPLDNDSVLGLGAHSSVACCSFCLGLSQEEVVCAAVRSSGNFKVLACANKS